MQERTRRAKKEIESEYNIKQKKENHSMQSTKLLIVDVRQHFFCCDILDFPLGMIFKIA